MAQHSKTPADVSTEPVVVVERPGAERGYGKSYAHIVRDRSLPRNVKTLYTYFATYANGTREAYPSRQTIADDVDLSVSAVDEAVKIGSACKLWHIVKVPTRGGYAYNKYVLHDLDGVYIVGSGPGKRAKGKPRGRAVAKAVVEGPPPKSGSGHLQNLGVARPKSGPEVDNRTRPAGAKTSSTPPREAIADARPQAAGRSTKITLRFPANFDSLGKGDAVKCIVKAIAGAMTAAGRPLGRNVGNRISKEFSKLARPQDATGELAANLTRALTGDAKLSWLFEPHDGRKRVQVSADPVFLHERYGAIPGAEACIDAMDGQGYSPHAIANTIAKTARDMDCEDEIPEGHYTGDDIDPAMYPDYGKPVGRNPFDSEPFDPWTQPKAAYPQVSDGVRQADDYDQ